MVLIPVGYAQANFKFTGVAVPLGAEVTLGLDVGGATDPAVVAEALEAAWNTSDLPSVIATGASLTTISVKFGPTATGPSADYAAVSVSDGGTPSDSPGTSTLVHKHTALGGRAGRGRMYLPATPDLGVDVGGRLTTEFIGQVATRLDDFAAQLVLAALDPVVLHGVGSPIATPTPITSFRVDGQVATQRRRNRR